MTVAYDAYEATLKTLTEAELCLRELVSREEASALPDRQAIAHWSAGAWWCAQERQNLRPDDRYEVARVRRQWETLVIRMRQELIHRQGVA